MMLMILGLFSVQWIALKLQYIAFSSWLDSQMIPMSGSFEQAIGYDGALSVMFPASLFNFFIHQVLIALAVLFIFAFVLIERSLWQRTVWAPFLALLMIGVVVVVPMIGFFIIENYLFMEETLAVFTLILVIWFIGVVWIGYRQLTKKLSV